MAAITKCDRCGTTENADGMITILRERKCKNQHDGEYTMRASTFYDVCEKCAREIELLFVSEEEADKTILT